MSKMKAVVVNDTRLDKHYGCDLVMYNLNKILKQSNIEVMHYHPVGKDWRDDPITKKYIIHSDVVIVNGEGSIHHSNHKARSLSRLGQFAKHHNKISILLNATLYKNNKPEYDCLNFYDYLFVRDNYSIKECLANNITKAKYLPDLTFYSNFMEKESYIGTVVVGESVVKNTRDFLVQFSENNNLDRLFILHKNNNSLKSNVMSHIEEMKKYGLVITGRFHTVCFCINTRLPFIAVESNTNKISSLLFDCFGSYDRLIVTDRISHLDLEPFKKFSQFEIERMMEYKKNASLYFSSLQKKLTSISRSIV